MHDTHATGPIASANGVPPERTSELLRGILTNNPDVEAFSVERILAALGEERLEASLMVFSLPGIVPVPTQAGGVSLPTAAVGCQLFAGQKQLQIPRFVLTRTISRKALAVAIHAVLPLLEASEKTLRRRWNWVSHANTRRAVGVFVFLLALAIAWPLFGFNALHATSIFVMALGMAEQDGLAVLIGALAGVLSLVLFAAAGLSGRALRAKAATWLRKLALKLGLSALAKYLHARGHRVIAQILTFQWSNLLLIWDPERNAARRARAGRSAVAKALPQPRPAFVASASGSRAMAARRSAVTQRPAAARLRSVRSV